MPAVADDVDRWIQNLQDPSPSVREAAAENLGDLGNTRAVDPLILALNVHALYSRGEALRRLSRYAEAIEDIDRAIEIDAGHARA